MPWSLLLFCFGIVLLSRMKGAGNIICLMARYVLQGIKSSVLQRVFEVNFHMLLE